MAKAILMSGGVGGVTSDDVTASKAQVLQGYKTVTADSDDEVVEGTMSNRGNGMVAVDFTNAHWESKFVARMEEGYYSQAGQWKPYVAIPYAVLANVVGVDPAKMLQTLTIAGKQGQIKTIKTSDDNYKVNKQNSSYGIDGVRGTFYIDMPHGNAYYCRDDGHPHTCIDVDKLGDTTADKVLQGSTFTSKAGVKVPGTMSNRGNGMDAIEFYNAHWESKFVARMEPGYYSMAGEWKPYVAIPYAVLANIAGVDPAKMLQGYSIAGVQGAIPRWVCTTGDVITALGGEGFAWDDIYAGRGRGIVMKIPNKRFIQDANYAFLPSPNLYPQNVVKDININGVTGTRDFVDHVTEYTVTASLGIDMTNREQVISLGTAYSRSQTVFFAVYLVGEDVDYGFVRRDMGNGRYLIGRIPVSKNDSNFIGTYVRNVPIQIEIKRDNAGNISLVHHGPNQVLGVTNIMVTIYAHSSTSFSF